jgi:hypothetical protein
LVTVGGRLLGIEVQGGDEEGSTVSIVTHVPDGKRSWISIFVAPDLTK